MPSVNTVQSKTTLVGVDEAGRGPLAGPVVAAACVLVARRVPVRIDDSKRMTALQRDESFLWLTSRCVHGIGIVAADEIDRIGILAATEKAMRIAVAAVAKTHASLRLLVDGRDAFTFMHPHLSIVRGDASRKCIGAASIIAKVTRDRLMCDYATIHPVYGFERHKGYGTKAHIEAIRQYGACPLHRKQFVSGIIAQ